MTQFTRDGLFISVVLALLLGIGAAIAGSTCAPDASADVFYGPNARPEQVNPAPAPRVILRPPAARPARPGIPVYDASECIGAVVAGVCNGTVIETDPVRPRCYGVWTAAGTCTGPVF